MTRIRVRTLGPSCLALSLIVGCGDDGAGANDDTGATDGSAATMGDDGSGDETAADGTGGETQDGSDDGPSPNCGNGVIDDDETCDGDDLGGATCADFGGETGELSCNACQIDSSACGLLPATQFGDGAPWSLPDGGDSFDGFYNLSGSEWDDGDQSWSTVDLTGDGLPDLVITNEGGDPITSGGDQYWWVYPNTGDGFGEVTTWALPNGGDAFDGFYALGGSEWDDGDQSWSTVDLTGDGRPDLVVTNEGGDPITSGGDQYWWVYPNTGDGFGEATTWALPNGGDAFDGFYALGGSEWDDGDQSWSTVDLTGDGLPDLVITNEGGDPITSGGD
ncbi:MAG: VCBS repeat-containing protein, partial [Myxococcota bacterium]